MHRRRRHEQFMDGFRIMFGGLVIVDGQPAGLGKAIIALSDDIF